MGLASWRPTHCFHSYASRKQIWFFCSSRGLPWTFFVKSCCPLQHIPDRVPFSTPVALTVDPKQIQHLSDTDLSFQFNLLGFNMVCCYLVASREFIFFSSIHFYSPEQLILLLYTALATKSWARKSIVWAPTAWKGLIKTRFIPLRASWIFSTYSPNSRQHRGFRARLVLSLYDSNERLVYGTYCFTCTNGENT